jgi:hypothetical protein
VIDTFITETYFNHLKTEAFLRKEDQRNYEGVLRLLHDIPFTWLIHADDNRAGDAMTFRQSEFLDQFVFPSDVDLVRLGQWATATPSVLEVLLGCARRWVYYFGGQSVAFYFGHMFRGLDLQNFNGRTLNLGQQEAVRNRIDIWLNRQFEPDGTGSPWPLLGNWRRYEDQRKVDMWAQMNAYSAEHFQ